MASWTCSECGGLCSNLTPHTCYADYKAIKAEHETAIRMLRGIVNHWNEFGATPDWTNEFTMLANGCETCRLRSADRDSEHP